MTEPIVVVGAVVVVIAGAGVVVVAIAVAFVGSVSVAFESRRDAEVLRELDAALLAADADADGDWLDRLRSDLLPFDRLRGRSCDNEDAVDRTDEPDAVEVAEADAIRVDGRNAAVGTSATVDASGVLRRRTDASRD